MGLGDWLQLNVGNKCDINSCICSHSGIITASKDTVIKNVIGFHRYIHKIKEGTFTLKRTLGNGEKLGNGQNFHGVENVSVYYWDGDDKENKPLLVGVTTKDHGTTKYYSRSREGGNGWKSLYEYTGQRSPDISGELLEKELEKVLCYQYDHVTLNLTKKHSEQHANGGNKKKYCCGKHKGDDTRVTVSEGSVSCKTHKSYAPYFQHSIDDGYTLASIKYYPKGSSNSIRKRIKLKEYPFPISSPLTVSVFHCTGEAPILIYIEGGTSGGSATGWFKKPKTSNSNGDEDWEGISPVLKDITPDNITECNQWSDLVKELHCNKHKDCTISHSPVKTESDSARDEDQGYTDGETNSDDSQSTESESPSDQVPDTESETKILLQETPVAQMAEDGDKSFPWEETVFGTLATVVSGLVGFAGFKFYTKYKGDPWVRQI